MAKLTSLAKWSRVRATASVLAVRELIVARRRSPGERGSKDANTPKRSRQARRGWVGAAGAVGRVAGRRVPEMREGCGVLLSRSFRRSALRARILLGGALARGLPQRAEPAFLWAGAAPRVAVT